MSKIIIALGAVIVLGGGVSLAAANAVPGNTLYGYKLSVNENVGGLFAISENARTERHIKLAERRLSEAAEASAHADVESEAYASLMADFNVHMKVLSDAIAKLDAEGHTEASRALALKVARILSAENQDLLAAQTAATNRGDVATTQSLDFILLNVSRSLTAAAVIAATGITAEGDANGAAGTQLEGTPEVPDADLNQQ